MFHPSGISLEEKYSQIGGWLLFFCISLFLMPVMSTINIFKSIQYISEYSTEFPIYYYVSLSANILDALIMLFSLYCGVIMLQKKAYSTKITKIFLISYLSVAVFFVPLSFIHDLPPEYAQEHISHNLTIAIRCFIYCIIWLLYLNKSERVRYTYKL